KFHLQVFLVSSNKLLLFLLLFVVFVVADGCCCCLFCRFFSSNKFTRTLQLYVDSLVPWQRCRWLSFAVLAIAFTARIALIERHFFSAYFLAIYFLNQLLLFLSPATEDDDLPAAPKSGEYRPFVRALSEFKLWIRGFLGTAAAISISFFDYFDVDVDGGALVCYFTLLFIYTMKQQIFHMIKYSYVPWSGSKKSKVQQKGKDESLDV
ncbi:unnamed protein product, partial [Polarella glacialis]